MEKIQKPQYGIANDPLVITALTARAWQGFLPETGNYTSFNHYLK
jgi:hypothetical protein